MVPDGTNAGPERHLTAQAPEPATISIGTALLNDVIRRAIQTAEISGGTALLVYAILEQARRFYLSRGCIESPVKPMTQCPMLATVEQAWREPQARPDTA